MRIEEGFQPTPFTYENAYTTDPVIPALLRRTLPQSAFKEVDADLERFGGEVITSILELGKPERVTPPTLVQYDQWGRRVDELHTSEGWRNLKAVAQKEGLPGIFYERKYDEHSRSYGFSKMMLMSGEAHMVFCPISMTDGAARVIELLGSDEMKKHLLPRLISRDPSCAFTSGQWMTERPGGSDVSQTETVATPTGESHAFGPKYRLNGLKWFSSATDSDISVALARTGSVQDGSRGLSLFLIPLKLPLLRPPFAPVPSAMSNNIFVHRLKNKIGTHTLPTAELTLESTEAYLIGKLNQGVKNISPVLNITRLWSASGSVGALRRCLSIATSYAKVRSIEGGRRLLQDAPLHVAQLASINLLYRALAHFTFGTIRLLGKSECNIATADDLRMLRMLTPTTKAFVAEKAVAGIEEAMTTLGGAGYMEENGFGRMIRDTLVEKIWEGTTTVLALDLARAAKDPAAINAFALWVNKVVSQCPADLRSEVQEALGLLSEAVGELADVFTGSIAPLTARPALILVGYTASSTFLLEHAIWAYETKEPTSDIDTDVFKRWVLESGMEVAIKDVKESVQKVEHRIAANAKMVFGSPAKSRL